ncbi:type II toxin-antitoxin system VapB family antitoxin [Hydrocarboniphaga sp.]|uniref:type II toxin-antitoxin system VapB family antitoxin n=1 Tax=Hydrocarboniphaga sp. TaxID=2033016 RepID=UPI0034559B97
MALNIENPEVERKAIEVSRILALNKTAAIEGALDLLLAQIQSRGMRTRSVELGRRFRCRMPVQPTKFWA